MSSRAGFHHYCKMVSYAAAVATATLIGRTAGSQILHNIQKRDSVQGFDISSYQPNVDFSDAYANGVKFVIIKATEGTDYTDPDFSQHHEGATSAGMIRGGYHFAHPNEGTGADQANFFLQNGGGWSGDGQTLPGMLDIEYGTSSGSSECWGVGTDDMVSWITDFVNTYQSATGVYPIIYTTADWWSTCTGDATDFSSTCPLNLADYNSDIGTIPGGWPYQTFWQYTDDFSYGGDGDRFNGSDQDLQDLADG